MEIRNSNIEVHGVLAKVFSSTNYSYTQYPHRITSSISVAEIKRDKTCALQEYFCIEAQRMSHNKRKTVYALNMIQICEIRVFNVIS